MRRGRRATKRCTVCGGGTHADGRPGTFGGAPCGATKRCPGRGDACGHPHWGIGSSTEGPSG
eukprot:3422561-Pyramimonas_sp.AAC.1